MLTLSFEAMSTGPSGDVFGHINASIKFDDMVAKMNFKPPGQAQGGIAGQGAQSQRDMEDTGKRDPEPTTFVPGPRFDVRTLPRGGIGALATTSFTVCVDKERAHEIGRFLCEQVFGGQLEDEGFEATLLKVRPWKHWVSANIVFKGEMVKVRAQVWARRDGDYILELQLRSGCAMTFSRVYRKVLALFVQTPDFEGNIKSEDGQFDIGIDVSDREDSDPYTIADKDDPQARPALADLPGTGARNKEFSNRLVDEGILAKAFTGPCKEKKAKESGVVKDAIDSASLGLRKPEEKTVEEGSGKREEDPMFDRPSPHG